jgi:7-keto-8-aminopelargonate synthetase-like enzyme
MGFETQIREALLALERAGLRRHPKRISGPQGPEVVIDGRRVLCFCSNNYLGLADHPTIVDALRGTAAEEGVGAAASRLISGTMDAHEELEAALADFQRRPAALLYSSKRPSPISSGARRLSYIRPAMPQTWGPFRHWSAGETSSSVTR